jgi:hypothetical protein
VEFSEQFVVVVEDADVQVVDEDQDVGACVASTDAEGAVLPGGVVVVRGAAVARRSLSVESNTECAKCADAVVWDAAWPECFLDRFKRAGRRKSDCHQGRQQ